MARYIDADELIKATKKRVAEANSCRMAIVDGDFLDLINDAEIEDVVEVVRCKDCKYAKPMSFKGYFMCKRHHKYCRKADDFCSYGERREQ